jgi:acyl transferase domain-containing protein
MRCADKAAAASTGAYAAATTLHGSEIGLRRAENLVYVEIETLEERLAVVVGEIASLRAALLGWLDGTPSAAVTRGSAARAPAGAAPGDAMALAAHWVAGGAVEWAQRFDGARRRIRLPTTVFARERCWLPEAGTTPRAIPLLGAAIPTLAAEARWRVTLEPAHPVLDGHVVGDRPILPGVAVLELAAAAARALGRAAWPLRLADIAWLAPVTTDIPGEFVLRPAADGALDIVLEAAGRPRLRGRLLADGPQGAEPAPLGTVAAAERLDGAAVTAQLDALGLRYGPGFRAITALTLGEAEAIAEVALPDAPGFEACLLHPGLLDAVLQAAAMLVFRRPGARRMLPVGVDTVELRGPLPKRGRVEARLLTPPDRLDVAAFDAVLRDTTGAAVAIFRGLSGRVDHTAPAQAAPVRAPLILPDPPLGDWFFAPDWVATPAPSAPTAAAPLILATEPAIPGVPQPVVDEAKFPRISMIAPVKDRAKLKASWEKMNTSATGILAKMSEMTGNDVP